MARHTQEISMELQQAKDIRTANAASCVGWMTVVIDAMNQGLEITPGVIALGKEYLAKYYAADKVVESIVFGDSNAKESAS